MVTPALRETRSLAQGFGVSCERLGRLGHLHHDQLERQRLDARKDVKLKEPRVKSEFTNVMPGPAALARDNIAERR